MLIFILDIILAFNLYLAIRFFKSIVSPPFLMGAGMLLASIISSFFYQEWSMMNFSFHSVVLLGGGSVFFTLCCILFRHRNNHLRLGLGTVDFNKWNLQLIFKILLVLDILYIFHILGIYYQMRDQFRITVLSDLIFARRLDYNAEDSDFELSGISIQISFFYHLLTLVSAWIFALIMNSKMYQKKNIKKIIYPIIILFFLAIIEGVLSGAKGNVLSVLFSIIFYMIIMHYSYSCSFATPKWLKKFIIVFGILGSYFFVSLSSILGRSLDSYNSGFEGLAVYCGAEIKNFDILINKNISNSDNFGAHVFSNIYSKLHIENNINFNYHEHQSINNHILGNVNTQFADLYVDFGTVGTFICIGLIAFIIMFIYNRSILQMVWPMTYNIYGILYCLIAYYVFNWFFAGMLSAQLFSPFLLKYGLGAYVLRLLFNKIVAKRY